MKLRPCPYCPDTWQTGLQKEGALMKYARSIRFSAASLLTAVLFTFGGCHDSPGEMVVPAGRDGGSGHDVVVRSLDSAPVQQYDAQDYTPPPEPDAGPVNTRPTLPMNPVPAPWLSENVGMPGMAGGAGRVGQAANHPGRFDVQGSGADVFGATDQFQFTHRPITGDFDFVARVFSLERVNENAKAGLMVRETMAPDSRNVFMLVHPQAQPGHNGMSKGTRLQFRDGRVDVNTGFFDQASLRPDAPDGTPIWLRLTRRGQIFTGSISADGITFIDDGTIRFGGGGTGTKPMPAQVEIGLAVTSHANDNTALAVFEGVRIDAITNAGWSHTEIGSVGSYAAGTPARFTIEAANRGLQNTRDGLGLVYRNVPLLGDLELTAHLTTLTSAGNENLRAGLVFRNGFDVGDRMAAFGISLTAANGQRPVLIRRALDNGDVTTTFPTPPPIPDGGVPDAEPDAAATDASVDAGPKLRPALVPTWLKLVRVGNRFAGFTSTNGVRFDYAFEVPPGFVIASNAFAGLFVTSQTEGAPAEATLEQVTIRQPPVTELPALPDAAPPPDAGTDAPEPSP